MKSKGFVRVIVFCTIFTMLFTSMALAVSFTDINNHWAKTHIKKMAEKGIIEGNPDGTFKPDDNVTLLQAFVMMSRMYNIEDKLIEKEIYDNYKDFLKETCNGEYEWAYDELSIALAADIVLKGSLKYYFTSGKIHEKATKEEIATFLTKAMLLDNEAKNQTDCTLPFNDADKISATYKPYVYTMYDKGIINGDDKNNVSPNSLITRAVMAKMLSKSVEYMEDNDIEPDFSSFVKDLTTVEGVISDITKSQNTTYIKVKKADGYSAIYETNKDMILTVEGKKATVSDLVIGMCVECKVKDDEILRSVKAEHKSEEYKGKVNYASYVSPKEISIILKDDDDKEKTRKFAVNNEVNVILNGKEVEFKELNRGDMVTVKVKNEKVHEIVAESKNKIYQGVFDQIVYERTIKIAFTDLNDKAHELELTHDDLDVKRNDKKSSIDQLRKGDKIEVETEYDLIKSIDAISVESESKGYIKQIVIGPKNKLTLSSENQDSVEYIVSENASINIEKKLSSIYDLRLGYYIEFNMQGEEIVSIDAKAIADSKEISGIVSSIYSDIGVLMLSVTNNSGNIETKRIEVTSKTRIIDLHDARSKKLSNIDVGDEIIIVGTNENGLFTATNIIIR